jgi:hypothetical protein
MSTNSIACTVNRVAMVLLSLLASLGPLRVGPAHGADARVGPARVSAASAAPAAAPTAPPQPATPDEAQRFAERERQDAGLAGFEGGARISTTTIIIILLLVIILLILL